MAMGVRFRRNHLRVAASIVVVVAAWTGGSLWCWLKLKTETNSRKRACGRAEDVQSSVVSRAAQGARRGSGRLGGVLVQACGWGL